MTSTPGAPAPIFEGSEKRLELHFSFCHPQSNTPGTHTASQGLRVLSRSTLDELMTLAACEILSSTSNSSFDAYVLSESSLFVYPTTWILKTCGNTRPLACLEELLTIAAQHNMKPSYVKYSHASYLHPLLQPPEYRSFPDEIAEMRKHIGHLGNGGSAYQLGDSLYGLQWHVFVASEPNYVPLAVNHPADYGMDDAENENSSDARSDNDSPPDTPPDSPTGMEASVEKVREAPLKTLEVCMTELDVEAAQLFVRSPSFVSSAHTTRDTGIDMLLPGAQIDDHMFEPCGYSMNGITSSQHITIHITPEEGFSYASCEIYGTSDTSVDPSATVASLTSIFSPGRFVVAYATTSTTQHVTPPYINVAGYCCVGASCQGLPADGAVYFFSFIRDTFRASQGANGCPAALKSCPSFRMLSSADDSSAKTTMELDDEPQKRKMSYRKLDNCQPLSNTGSSGSDMDAQDQEFCCDADASTGEASTHGEYSNRVPAQHACELIEANPPSDTFFLLDLRVLSVNLAAWKATLPSVTLFHSVRDCDDSAVLRHMHEQGASFLAESIAHVEALSSSRIAMAAVAANVQCWRRRQISRAVELGVTCFRVNTLQELELLQRYSGNAHCEVHIVISSSDNSETRSLLSALTGEHQGTMAPRRVVIVSGVVVNISSDGSDAQEGALDAAQRVCASLKAAEHSVQSVAFTGVEGTPVELANLLARQHAWLQELKASIDCRALMRDVMLMVSHVLSVDITERRMHVTDVPSPRVDQNTTVELLRMFKHSQNSPEQMPAVDDAVEQYNIADGATSAVYALPTSVCCGDWLLWAGCSAVDVQSAFWAVDRYYV